MKNIKYFALILATLLSGGAFAADSVSAQQSENYSKMGVVTADNATTLDDLAAALAEKATAAGAKAFIINSVSGNNRLHGSAVLLK